MTRVAAKAQLRGARGGSYEAKLKTARREGEAFDVAAGLPRSMSGQAGDQEALT
jgi:hypothetical protein